SLGPVSRGPVNGVFGSVTVNDLSEAYLSSEGFEPFAIPQDTLLSNLFPFELLNSNNFLSSFLFKGPNSSLSILTFFYNADKFLINANPCLTPFRQFINDYFLAPSARDEAFWASAEAISSASPVVTH
ncbi:hypothetical protein H0H93_014033, partial [Arthromyces matolae]